MMTRLLSAVAVMLTIHFATPFAVAQATRPADPEAQEPPLEFSLQLGDQTVDVTEGRSFAVEIGGKKLAGTLTPKADRLFSAGPVSFRYPREFAFEADLEDPAVANWTLDGNNTVIMLFRYGAAIEPDQARKTYVSGASEQFGRGNTKREPTKLDLAGRKLAGDRLIVTVAGTKLWQDVFAFKAGESTYALIIQDSLQDDGTPSAELSKTSNCSRRHSP